MAEQVSRFRGLRRITSVQERILSPSYRVHKLNFLPPPFPFAAPPPEYIQTIEVEATDLIIPYSPHCFSLQANGNSLFNGMEWNFYLNDNRSDRLMIWQWHVPIIRNFPFYRVVFEVTSWPTNYDGEPFTIEVHTFTNPRIIEDIKNG